MLIDTLRAIDEMDSYSKSKLAGRLHTSEEVIEHLLAQLESKGYIREEDINASKCDSCPKLNRGCLGALSDNPINTLTITEKGRKLIKTQG